MTQPKPPANKYAGPSKAQQAARIRNHLILRIRGAYSLHHSLRSPFSEQLTELCDAILADLKAEPEGERRARWRKENGLV